MGSRNAPGTAGRSEAAARCPTPRAQSRRRPVCSDGSLRNGLQNAPMLAGGGHPTLPPWSRIGERRLHPPDKQQDDAPPKDQSLGDAPPSKQPAGDAHHTPNTRIGVRHAAPQAPPYHLAAFPAQQGVPHPRKDPSVVVAPSGTPPAPQEPGCSHGPQGSPAPQPHPHPPVGSPPPLWGIQPPKLSLPLPQQGLSQPEHPAPAAAAHLSPREPGGRGSHEKTGPDFIKSSAPVNIKKKSDCASREVLN